MSTVFSQQTADCRPQTEDKKTLMTYMVKKQNGKIRIKF